MTDNKDHVLNMDEVLVAMAKTLTGETLELSDEYKVIINGAANLFMSHPSLYHMFCKVIDDSQSGILPYESMTVQ